MMLKGLTAQYLLRRTYKVQKGDNILIHAASGGVGMITQPMGEASRRQRHRHCRFTAEGDGGARPWLRPHDSVSN